MKLISVIWIFSVLFLVSGLHAAMDHSLENTMAHHSCCHDNTHHEKGETKEDPVDRQGDIHDCYPGCGCGCSHVTVFEFSFMAVPGIPVQHYVYAGYTITYNFDYASKLLDPPRIG
jgi:hypothetical protein